MNSTVQTPRVCKVTLDWSVSVPALYAVVMEQVIVILPDVLLKIEITSPLAKVASGMVMLPPGPTSTYSPTSEVAKV